MENFRRFAPSEALFCPIFGKKRNIFGALRHLKWVMKIFNGTGVKKQGRNWHVLVQGGEKNWNFWPKYLPLFCGRCKRGSWQTGKLSFSLWSQICFISCVLRSENTPFTFNWFYLQTTKLTTQGTIKKMKITYTHCKHVDESITMNVFVNCTYYPTFA